MHSIYPSDQELVSQMERGDSRAFEAIYRRYWRNLYNFVYQQLESHEESEEVVHDLMLSLWKNRNTAATQNLRVYLFIAARNLTNKCIRSRINLRKYKEFVLLRDICEQYDTHQIQNFEDLTEAIEKVLRTLPDKTATIFRMSKMEELPVRAIASKLDLTEKAVEYHITKSLKTLRLHLQNYHSNN